jgi:hypothetical protein
MRLALIVLTLLPLLACSREGVPPGIPTAPSTSSPLPAPDPPAPPAASAGEIRVMVVGPDGACIPDATVQVIAGDAGGPSARQTEPCGVWDYGGELLFKGLTVGVDVTLRASAPDYIARDQTATPETAPVRAIIVELRRTQRPVK